MDVKQHESLLCLLQKAAIISSNGDDDDDDDDDCFYTALFSALEHSLRSRVILST